MSRSAGYRHPAEYTLRAVLSLGSSGRPEFVLRALPTPDATSTGTTLATSAASGEAAAHPRDRY